MADYIRREDALFALRKAERGGSMTALTRLERAYAEIREMPAADVAPVVRCKDCRHSKYAAWCEGYACCRTVGEYHHADFGCTDGKLRTNGVTE
jgi:hypothetical protein|nr:MAG TPA: hypothetical protein [Caudoviricetes sp.]